MRSGDWAEAKARARQFSKELTPRQRDIVQLFGEGWLMKEIAALPNLSEKTVEFHKHHIMVSTLHVWQQPLLLLFASAAYGLVSRRTSPSPL
jgi:DNA-binding NarL/FixJ family response regulator